ncbi:peptidoglycan/LPS O-acetylase OafA/YrhL [Maribacter vaceletii]|uniref:Peptidoglycan/LPS O-acetylase OafA/YrhL n=1 Tax=Maribacter vaceletii TaxID=1206816 RepID=A0A495EDB1_9FLAO|nr:acyltransferase [Maribacter vaceletii]RKR14641.1 peptidoglycan/LPS O-acetylase OafA/YrhL [Maribacter vaceletii]
MVKSYLYNLSALRGIAAIMVVTLHFHFFLGGLVPYKNAGLVDKLYLMVDLFFILSGFIMCYVYETSFTTRVTRKKYKSFLIARLARIYPLHIITLFAKVIMFITVVLIGKFHLLSDLGKHIYRLDAIPVQLVFLQTIGIYNFDTWNAPAWSLSAEWWAYVIFPFLFIMFRKLGFKNWWVGGILVILGWLSIEFLLAPLEPFFNFPLNPNHKTLDVNWHYGTIRGIVGFMAGMIVWQLFKTSKGKKWIRNGWFLSGVLVLCLISMQFKWYDTITVFLFTPLILSLAYGSKNANYFLGLRLFQKLGKWSFSIYIWHMIFMDIILLYFRFQSSEKLGGLIRPIKGTYVEKWTYFILCVAFICFMANLSYRYIETPTRNWIKNKFNTVN